MTVHDATSKQSTDEPLVQVSWWQRPLVFISGHSIHYLERSTKSDLAYAVALGLVALVPVFSGSLAMFVALKMHVTGDHAHKICVGAALVFGLVILWIDRFLMAMPMRRVDIDTANGEVTLRNGPIWTVLVAAAPRVLTAVVISFILAEPLLVKYFEPEVEQRVKMMQADLAREAGERQNEENEKNRKNIPGLTPEQQQYYDLDTKTIPERKRAIEKQRQVVAECKRYYENELTGGQTVTDAEGCKPEGGPSTGRAGDGPKAAAALANLKAAEQKLANMQSSLENLESERDATPAAVVEAVADYQQSDAKRAKDDRSRVNEAREKAETTDGLLIRMTALEELAHDKTPFSKNDSPRDDEEGSTAASSKVETASFLGITLMGMQIWAARLIIMIFDTMPILGKVLLACRSRRVYDEVVALDQHRKTEQARLDASADHIRQAILQSSMEESARAFIQDAGGAWIKTQYGAILVGPDGSVFAPWSTLDPESLESRQGREPGIRFTGSEDGSVTAEETNGKSWPSAASPDRGPLWYRDAVEHVNQTFPDDASLDDEFLEAKPPKNRSHKDRPQPASPSESTPPFIDLRGHDPKDPGRPGQKGEDPDNDDPAGDR